MTDSPRIDSETTDDHELGNRFFDLIGVLSSIRSVLSIRTHPATEGQLLRLTLMTLVEHLHVQNCSVFLKQEYGLVCAVGASFEELVADKTSGETLCTNPTATSMVFQPGEGLVGMAYESKTAQYAGDCENDPRFVEIPGVDRELQKGSLVCIPLVNANDALGVLNVFQAKNNYFDTWQRSALALFADAVTQLLVNYRLVRDLDHKVAVRTAALERALGQSRKIREQLEKLSMTDELTGLMNRRSFFRSAKPMVSRAMRANGLLSLVLIDLDWFKRVNDNWGHVFGDKVLQQVAGVLSAELRDTDILARLGGEEFIILLPDTNEPGAVQLVQRIQESLVDIDSTADNSDIGVTASYGLTFLNENHMGKDPLVVLDLLYANADKAMYVSKNKGRNMWSIT